MKPQFGGMEQKPSSLIIASVILSLVAKVCQEVLLSTVLQTRYFQAGFSNSGPQYKHSSKHSIPTWLKPVTQVVWTLGIFSRGSHMLFPPSVVSFNSVVFLIVTTQPTFAWAKLLINSKQIKRPITKKEEETMTVLLWIVFACVDTLRCPELIYFIAVNKPSCHGSWCCTIFTVSKPCENITRDQLSPFQIICES